MGLTDSIKKIGAGGGGLSFMGSGLFGKDQSGNLRKLFMQMQRDQNLQFTRALGYNLQARKALETGFDSALTNVAGAADAERMDVLDAGARQQADLGQSLVGSGLNNTTIRGNAMGAAKGMQSRALATVNQNLARAKADVLAQKGMAMAGQFGNMSNLMMGQGAAQTSLQQLIWQRLASQPSPEDRFWQLLGSGSQLLGLGMGGGFGGGGGGGGYQGTAWRGT